MKKNLNLQELETSPWPKLIQEALGDNLLSAFVHGNCLMEGHSAINVPWTVSFILRNNDMASIAPLTTLRKNASRENITFNYFFTLKEIQNSGDVFPLEYLHIANRNHVLCGQKPLQGYIPHRESLRLECERELRGILIHMRRTFVNIEGKSYQGFCNEIKQRILPILYGVHYLDKATYPVSHQEIYDSYPILTTHPEKNELTSIQKHFNKYIETISNIINHVDTLEEK